MMQVMMMMMIMMMMMMRVLMMQAKRLLGVVVGSTDPGHHQRSLDQGEEAARIIEEYGNNKDNKTN